MSQCGGTTAKGRRCKNEALPGGTLCAIHDPNVEASPRWANASRVLAQALTEPTRTGGPFEQYRERDLTPPPTLARRAHKAIVREQRATGHNIKFAEVMARKMSERADARGGWTADEVDALERMARAAEKARRERLP